MTPVIYAAGAALTLLALALIVIPMLRHRKAPGVGVSLVAVILLFPLAVAGLYISVSSYPWDEQAVAISNAGTGDSKQPPVGEMITDLEARLEREPDVEGYVLLARSYNSLQRFPDAVEAWHKAWELTEGESAEVSLGYAESLILADRRTLKTSAVDLLDMALAELPDDPRALWYGGLSAAALGQNDIAADRFSQLLQADLPIEFRMVVQEQLAQLGVTPAMASAGGTGNSGAGGEGTDISIEATITLDPALAQLVPPNATLFVFAQNNSRPGPPIAAKRLSATFPTTAVLTDADVMIKGNSLGRAGQLKIAARVSASGNPIAAPGDLYGEVIPAKSEAGTIVVSVVIDSVEE
jgi:cytochrome c-type biogenesis protein CcmH